MEGLTMQEVKEKKDVAPSKPEDYWQKVEWFNY